jgi:DNA polymerase III alpha subunit
MDRLRQCCEERLSVVYQPEEQTWAGRRLHQELKVIQAGGQGQTFEEAQRSVRLIRDQGGDCRLIGAGCSALVSYLLGLSDIDPITHGLLFERFLEANSLRTVQFQFVAYWKAGPVEAERQPIHDGPSNRAVRIQHATPFEAVPELVTEEIRRNDHNFCLTSIPPHDELAYLTLQYGYTDGLSQFDSLDARRLLSDLKPRSLTEIAAIKAILIAETDEPGILDEFVQRGFTKNRQVSAEWLVQKTLDDTRGMILFQEQIMLVLNRVADIPLSDAYTFIKAVCKRRWEQVATFREWFVAAGVGNGMDEPQALTLFESIRNSATRAVCKAQHLSEALTTYRTAFLKAHFPREFDRALHVIQQ